MNDTVYIEPLDDNDFSELLIRHMLLMPDVLKKAQQFKLTGDDMMLDDIYGNLLYKALIDIIIGVGSAPITLTQLFNGLKNKFELGILPPSLKMGAADLIDYFYDPDRPLEPPEFFDHKLAEFIKKRRANKLIKQFAGDLNGLTAELNRLNMEFNGDSEMEKPRIVNPYSNIIFKTKNTLIGTYLPNLDKRLEGLMLGEYGMIIGYSGCGKSSLGVNIVAAAAEVGHKATYISCEEDEQDMSQRFYSKTFRILYTQLRQGKANIELQNQFDDATFKIKKEMLAKNLCLIGLKGVTDITPNYLYEVLNQHYEKTGFIPEIVMLDQLQFVHTNADAKRDTKTWELERDVAAELDQLSHRQIGGKNFVLWVQHQAKGKIKASFTREEIDGFKGIIHKADLVLGLGREDKKSEQMSIFTLKTRHIKDFEITLKTELEYMTVTDVLVSDTMPEPNPDKQTMTLVNNKPILKDIEE